MIANSIARLEAALNTLPEQFQALQEEVYQPRTLSLNQALMFAANSLTDKS
ncbi:hypothetical protein RQP50_22150 [Paenibacillus sp. chi10]|uniref:Uncharacterized protein n=1 Tax=Paenibacillus suaedae TaxID=3077233 RepID=A0AAJ2N6T5_9BACL|nr:hypothetical protein [Paenibacillus sp. chi10]MDT8978945.1 hypothetical protein [Paenibacillus sp. chi10]